MYTVEALPESPSTSPRKAQLAYAELIGFLELTPEHGTPYRAELVDGNMRTQPFGNDDQGLATYLMLRDELRVVVLIAVWLV